MIRSRSLHFNGNFPSPYAWDPSHLVDTGRILDTGNSSGVFFKPDGLEMYVYNFSQTIKQYTLTEPFNHLTGTLVFTFVSGKTMQDVSIRESDGLKMYSFGASGFYEFDFGVGWDLSTASFTKSQVMPTYMTGCYMKQDGTTAYATNQVTDGVYEFDLSTPWDSASQSQTAFKSVVTDIINPQALWWRPDGSRLFVLRIGLRGYDVDPPWRVGAGMVYKPALDSGIAGNGMFWTTDGIRCFIAQANGIREYTIQ